jgi:hypothetical protein
MPQLAFDKIVIVTRKTGLEELIERFSSEAQARFYIERLGDSFESYASSHRAFHDSLEVLNRSLPDIRCQRIDRSFLANFLFGPKDLVVVLGHRGLLPQISSQDHSNNHNNTQNAPHHNIFKN